MRESRKSTLSELNGKNGVINTQSEKELDKSLLSDSGSNASFIDNVFHSNDKSKHKKQKDQMDIDEVRKDINDNMPMRFSEKNKEKIIFSEKNSQGEESILIEGPVEIPDEIEVLLNDALSDRKRSSLFFKVRDAIKVYRAERDPKAKVNMLLGVRESAFNYLLEKRGEAPERKQMCSNIISLIDSFAEKNGIQTERNLDYLIENERISDNKLDLEIRLAGKLTVKSNDTFVSDLSDRRKAFRRKIKDVRLARSLKKKLVDTRNSAFSYLDEVKDKYVVYENERNADYDDAVKNIVAAYMNMDSVNGKFAGIVDYDEEKETDEGYRKQIGANMLIRLSASDNKSKGRVAAKCHMIEAILTDILKWDPDEFKFKKPEDFLNRGRNAQESIEKFMELYNKLRVADHADVLFNELLYQNRKNNNSGTLSQDLLKEAKAKILLCKEIKKEYTERLFMMNSPYYALLLQKDTQEYNTPAKLNALSKDKRIIGIDKKKSVGSAFKDFVISLKEKTKRLVSGKTGREFTRNTDPIKLLKSFRTIANATAAVSKRRIGLIAEKIDKLLTNDNLRLLGKWEQRESARPIIREAENTKINDELNLINNEDEKKDDDLFRDLEKSEDDILRIVEPEEKKDEGENPGQEVHEENIPEEVYEEPSFKKELKDKQTEIIGKAGAKVSEINAALEKESRERIKQQIKEEKEKRQNEIKEKQAEISKKAGAKAAAIDEQLEKESRERIAKHMEEDRKKATFQKAIKEKQTAITAKSGEWLKKYEEAKEAKANERILLSYLLEGYEKLSKGDATMEDAYSLRERMIERLIAFTGVENSVIEFTPTDELVKFIKYVLDNQFAKGAKEELAGRIEALDESYTDTTDDTALLDRVKKLMSKGDKMTALDKLLAYDYNTLLICMNRSREDGDIKYNDYKGFDLSYLTQYAADTSRYTSTQPEEEGAFGRLSEEQARDHEKICREILSEYTGKEADYFRVIPIATLSKYAFDVHDIINKKKAKAAADKCLKLAGEIYGRIDSIDDALKKNDRAGILDTITKLSGINTKDLDGYATVELRDLLESMYVNVNAPKALSKETANIVKEGNKLFDADYYLKRLKDSHRKVWLKRDLGDEAAFDDLRSMAEYSILYLRQHPGFSGLSFDDFSGLSSDSIYYIYRNVGIIEGLKGTDDPYEKNDIAKAIRELSGFALSDKLKSALEKTLDISLEEVPELIETEKKETVHIGKVELNDWKKSAWQTAAEEKAALKKKSIEERSKVKESEEHESFMRITESYQRQLDILGARRRKKTAAKVETEEERKFSLAAISFLSMLGDITELTGAAELDSALDKKIGAVLSDHADDVAWLMKQNNDRRLLISSVFTELKSGTTQGEKSFFEACENSFMPVINALSKALNESKDKALNKENIKKIISSGAINKALADYAAKVNENVELFEKEMLPVMTSATADVYNRGTEEENLPKVTELMSDDMKELVDLIDSESRKARFAAAKNTREREELKKKSDEQAEKERAQLNDMQESLLYDSKKGQGRFNQLLISGYYKNASRSDKRRMLSHVIRDMKKNNANISAKEKGCEYFASTMKGAGPLMQKMMQGVPERMLIPEMSVALGVVKSSLAPIDKKYVDEVFDEIIKDSNGAITSITERKSLGAASVAETFKCKIEGPDTEPKYVVVKILRPDAKENMKKDLSFVRRSAMFADMSDEEMAQYEKKNGSLLVKHKINVTESGFLAQFSEIEKEFDFTTEANNIKLGEKNYVNKYNKEKDGSDNYHVKSVHLNENFKPKKHYLVMDMAEGRTVDKVITQTKNDYKLALKTFKNTDSSVRAPLALNSDNVNKFWEIRTNLANSSYNSIKTGKLCAQLAYVWLEQALFGSKAVGFKDDPNFHHGDMHAGNIIVDGENTTVLDYGNAVVLKDSKVNQILSMISAAVINSAKHFVEAFNNLLELSADDEKKAADKVGYAPLTPEQQKEFVKKLDELFKLGTAEDTGKKILIALNVAQSLGVKLPKEIQNFSQCQQRLENTLQEVKDIAIKSTRMVDSMESLEIAPEDEDSFNPFIKLHKYHKQYNHRNKAMLKKFADRYDVGDSGVFMAHAGNADTKERLDELVGEYMPMYFKFKGKITAKEARTKAAEIRSAFNEAVTLVKKGKEVPKDHLWKLSQMVGYIVRVGDATGNFGGFFTSDKMLTLASLALNPLDSRSFDEDAFEQIIAMFESYIPDILEGFDSVYETLSDISSDVLKERARRMKVNDIIYDTCVAASLCKPEAIEIRRKLQGTKEPKKREEFERQAGSIIKDKTVSKKYKAFRNAEDELDKARLSKNKAAISSAEMKLKHAENDFLYSYMVQACNLLTGISDNYEENVNPRNFEDEDYLPDFVNVMGDVVEEHWKRCAVKVNKSLEAEINRIAKEKEGLEKQIKKEEEAELKKQKEEEERKRKEEAAAAKKKKAEEDKRKKEEAALAKKKKAEEDRRKKEEAALAKKKKAEEDKRKKEEAAALKKAQKEAKKKNKK